ncbi:hypothetical protein [Streptomyces sp. BE147]|uniref:hypothetical protein n=1 Tax=unclassified Streptomyces TaxID=2593676 RepID=UPI002E79340E|nr:hypothetical protein [Streptomyces sp. BE147]MEE1741906.1 hypothetical protein [Streptomyces sp. BE147]
MADEHYEWLDKDAAEKLLRGEPVVPVGDHARTDALRLTRALGEARSAARPRGGELPGEDRVLAAFRQAGHGAGTNARAARRPAAAAYGQPGLLDSVRIGGAGPVPPRRPRWSRPVRFGLVVSLAGCALGGVAVAAGTGIITGPFGGRDTPAPAASVSAAASPGEVGSGLPDDDGPSVGTSAPADPGATPDASHSPGDGRTGVDGTDRRRTDDGTGTGTATGSGGGTHRPDGAGPTGGSGDDADAEDLPDGSGDAASGKWYEKSVKACRDYRDGKLDETSRRRLIRLAKGEKNLERFCERLLDEADGDGQGGDGGNGDGEPGEGGGNGGSLPAISFRTQPAGAGTGPGAGAAPGAGTGSFAGPAGGQEGAAASSAAPQSLAPNASATR